MAFKIYEDDVNKWPGAEYTFYRDSKNRHKIGSVAFYDKGHDSSYTHADEVEQWKIEEAIAKLKEPSTATLSSKIKWHVGLAVKSSLSPTA